jgi:hypothetical protein
MLKELATETAAFADGARRGGDAGGPSSIHGLSQSRERTSKVSQLGRYPLSYTRADAPSKIASGNSAETT